jgi:hypothetical protein
MIGRFWREDGMRRICLDLKSRISYSSILYRPVIARERIKVTYICIDLVPYTLDFA